MNQKEKNKILFRVQDPEGRYVQLHNDTWGHISKRHPQIRGSQVIKAMVENPTFIIHNSTTNNIIYSDFTKSGLYTNVFTREEKKRKIFNVRTAFIEAVLPRGDVIWQRNKSKSRKST